MGKKLASIGLTVAMAVCVSSASAQVAPEFRAMACSRFQWPQEDPITHVPDLQRTKDYIDTLMQNLADHKFNAVILQMRGQCDTLYPSPYEPWSPILSSDGNSPAGWGDFDPMAYAINAAHAKGIEFHAYLNANVAWNGTTAPEYCDRHIYWEHCDITKPDKRDWLLCNSSGTPVGFSSEYVWVAPGVPSFQAYWRKQIMYVVEYYNGFDPVRRPAVDGVHFDRARLPSNAYSYDPISQSRRLGEGNPGNLSFGDWTADQITRMLIDVYAQVNEYTENISPTHHRVKVSSAPLGLYLQERYPGYPPGYQYARSQCFQDAQAWLAAGAQDFICPQIYWANEPYRSGTPHFSQVLPDWLAHNSGRHVYAYCNVTATGPGLLDENSEMRRLVTEAGQGNAFGTAIWSINPFNDNNYWPLFSGAAGPYEYPTITPPMPWKDTPTDAIILGTVTDGVNPIADVQITRTGTTYTALSSADGLYSFLKVPAGTYTLSYARTGKAGTTRQVTVTAGQVLRVPEVVLNDVSAPQISDVQAGNLANTSATITWTTDVGATSQVEYGTTASYGQITAIDSALVTSHSVNLTGLAAGTLYHYRVISSVAGLSSTSSDFTFTTTGSQGLPVIANVAAGGWGATTSSDLSAVITWTTDMPADTQVQYGLTSSYGSSSTLDPALATSHNVTLSGLAPFTVYHYRVRSAASTGASYSDDYTFKTGIVIDNTDPGCMTTGSWTAGTYAGVPRVGANYLYATGTSSQSSTTATCRWTPSLSVAGNYDVYVYYQVGHNRNSFAPFTVFYDGGQVTSIHNQNGVSADSRWFKIGSNLPFATGSGGYVQAANNSTTNQLVSADAAMFMLVCPAVAADFNRDCVVDQADLSVFEACAAGPGLPYDSGCTLTPNGQGVIAADFDGDHDVDQADFGIFQRCYGGGNPADPGCAD